MPTPRPPSRAPVLALAGVLAACGAQSRPRDVPWIHPPPAMQPATDGLLHIQVRETVRGEGVPCKVTVRGVDGTRDPSWGRDGTGEQIGDWLDEGNVALGIGRWILLGRGRGDVALPSGRYALTVTRGMEYAALDLGVVEVRPGVGAVVAGELRRVVDTEGEIAGEFHVHSAPSWDSVVPLDQRVLSLAVEGVEVFASTDHDALGDFAPAIESLGLQRHIHWIRGDEITADGFGHFNAYPLPEGLDPVTRLTHDDPSVARIIARAREVVPAGIVQLNHPLWNASIGYWTVAGFDPSAPAARPELYSLFDAVEVWNGHTLDQDDGEYIPVDRVIEAWESVLQVGRGPTAMGNTDTHRLAHSPPGWPRTYLRVPDDDPTRVTDAMVIDAIRAGDAMLTSGPFLRATILGPTGPVRPGGLARASAGRVVVHVELQAAAWTPAERVEVMANRAQLAVEPVTAAAVDGYVRQSWDLPVTLTRDAWIVVRTRAVATLPAMAGVHGRPMASLALVNPIYVDVDGDGRYTPPGVNGGP